MTEEAFRRHDDQGFAPFPHSLPAEQMEVLCGCCGHSDLDIVLRGEHEETFEAGAGVFRTHSFKTVWQEQDDATEPAPLFLRTGDELVNDDLGGVAEVPE